MTVDAASRGARSRRASATSTTSDRGPPARRVRRTSCACADATTASSSVPAGRVRLHPDARAVWTDPTGHVRTSWPRDLLDVVVLPAGRPASATVEATREATTSPEPGATGGAVLPSRGGLPSCDGGATALEVLLGVLVDHCPVPAVRAQAEVGTVAHGQPAMAGETTPTRARRPEVRVQVVRPDPRCRAVRYVDERPLHVGRSRSGACVTRPRHTAGAGPPPF